MSRMEYRTIEIYPDGHARVVVNSALLGLFSLFNILFILQDH